MAEFIALWLTEMSTLCCWLVTKNSIATLCEMKTFVGCKQCDDRMQYSFLSYKNSDQFSESFPCDFVWALKLRYQLGTIGRFQYGYSQKTEVFSRNRCFFTCYGELSSCFENKLWSHLGFP